MRKNRVVRLMWVEGEPISLIFSIRGYIHNDDGSIWDIYDAKKQVFWGFCHSFGVDVVSSKHCVIFKYFINWLFFKNHGNCYY
jgi:hypothetical protein